MHLKHPLQGLAHSTHTTNNSSLSWKTRIVTKPQRCPLPLRLAGYKGHRCSQSTHTSLLPQALVFLPSLVPEVTHGLCLTWPSENSSRQMAHTGAELQLLSESGHSARALLQLARYLLVASWLMAQAVRC